MIDSRAIVSPKAKLGVNVKIAPYAVIEDDVEIGDNCEIRSFAVIANGARLGKNIRVHSSAVISTEPQDLKYKDEPTRVYIGDDTVIREFATINRGTTATEKTVVGKNCLIMTYCHVAHDCVVGDNVIMSNSTQLGGHVVIEDWVGLGGNSLVHQFVVVGAHAFIGAGVKLTKDVCPYTLIGKNPAKIDNINKIGLKRRGFSDETIREIDSFYDDMIRGGKPNPEFLEFWSNKSNLLTEVKYIIDFIKNSKRGVYR